MRKFGWILLGLLVVVSPTAFAAEGRIPIFETVELFAANGPISGKYVVTRNIDGNGARVIDIVGTGVEDIELDLNGFTLRTSSDSVIHAIGVRTLIIRNGISQHTGATANIRVRDTERLIVENVNATGGKHGIFVDERVRAFIVRNNTITDVVEHGILVSPTDAEALPEIADGVVEKNLIQTPGKRGIEARWGIRSLSLVDNRIDEAGEFGITVNSTGAIVVADNKISGAGLRGIVVNRTVSCRVSGNVVKEAGSSSINDNGAGIDIADRSKNCLVLNNVSTNNYDEGIVVRGIGHHLDRNVVNENGKAGIRFLAGATHSTFGRNTARRNGTRLIPVGTCTANPAGPSLAIPEFCDESAASAATTTNTSFGDNLAPGPPPG